MNSIASKIHKHMFLTLIIAVVLLVPALSGAEDCVDYSDYLHLASVMDIQGYLKDIEVSGNFAFLTSVDSTFLVLDISDPLEPDLVASIGLGSIGSDLCLMDQQALISTSTLVDPDSLIYSYQITSVNIADPLSPVVAGSWETPMRPSRMTAGGGYAFVYTDSLRVVDFSNPQQPEENASLDIPGFDYLWDEGTLFVSNGDGVQIWDLADPQAPQLFSELNSVNPGPLGSGAMALDGHHLFVNTREGLAILDVADLEMPTVLGMAEAGGLFVEIEVADGRCYVLTPHEPSFLEIFNVEQPTSPVLEARFSVTNYSASDCALVGGNLLIPSNGLQVWDVSSLDVPSLVGETDPELDLVAQDAWIDGNSLVVHGSARGFPPRFSFLDITDLSQPVVQGELPTDYLITMTVFGGRAYGISSDGVLEIFDLTNLDSPQPVNSLVLPAGPYYNMTVHGDRLYVGRGTNESSGVMVFDLQDPLAPEEMGLISADYYAWDLVGNRFFGWDPDDGCLVVMDVSDPAAPETLEVFDPGPGHIMAVKADDTRVFMIMSSALYSYDSLSSLMVVDFSQPGTPVLEAEQVIWGDGWLAGRLELSDGQLYLGWAQHGGYMSGSLRGVQVIDVRDPTGPHLNGYFPLELGYSSGVCGPGGISFVEEHLYVAAGWAGVKILPLQCSGSVGIEDPEECQAQVIPAGPRLMAYPNPFNPRITLKFAVDHRDHVSLAVYDLAGRRIRLLADRVFPAGGNEVVWDGKDERGVAVASGTYFARMTSDAGLESQKVLLVR